MLLFLQTAFLLPARQYDIAGEQGGKHVPTLVLGAGCGMEINLRKQQQEQQEQQQQQDAGQQQETGASGPPPPAEPSSWQPTLDLLVARGLPCIFTCYNAADARDDVKVRRSCTWHVVVNHSCCGQGVMLRMACLWGCNQRSSAVMVAAVSSLLITTA
jgi:hypothetical protein